MSHEQSGHIEQYQFEDLVDLQAFAVILKNFAELTQIANGLVTPDGDLIASYGWQKACEDFHRSHPVSNQHCVSSNLKIMQEVQRGGLACSLCENGIIDYATPITIEGHTLATLFLGQVFHQPPDLDFFRQQAKQLNYDEPAYIEAIKAIPVISEAALKAQLNCIVNMAEMFAKTGLANLRRVKAERDLSKHKERRIQLEDILNSSPVAIGWSDLETGKIEYLNRAFIHQFGYNLADLPDINTWDKLAYPDADYRHNIITKWRRKVAKSYKLGTHPPELETDIHTKTGEIKHVLISISWVGTRCLVNFSDMTEHWLTEKRLHAHDQMLDMLATGTDLSIILNKIVKQVQAEDPSTLCSVLLLDESKQHLMLGAAPDLPDFYNQAINGIEIGPMVGSCGRAAFLAERVVVSDVMTSEYWAPFTELAGKADIRACWSEPLLSSNGEVLGSFAIYNSLVSHPTDEEIERIKFAANLAAIAVENDNNRRELEFRAYNDFLTKLPNRRYFIERAEKEFSRAKRYLTGLSLLMLDVDNFKHINDQFGHKTGDQVLEKLAEIIRQTLRLCDLAGRIGGEEFAVILPSINNQQAFEAAERLRQGIEQSPITAADGTTISFSASIGVASFTEHYKQVDNLLNDADRALYQAKSSGKNKVVAYALTGSTE